MENVLKRRDIKILSSWLNDHHRKGLESYLSSGYMKDFTVFSHDCIAVEMTKKKFVLNKPIQIGFCILEISKTKIYDFHYNFVRKIYGDNAKLAYTDTDSLTYQIFTKDLYEDLRRFISNKFLLFDTSNFPPNNQFNYDIINKKELGVWKFETADKLMTKFIGLRSKCYSYQVNILSKFIYFFFT